MDAVSKKYDLIIAGSGGGGMITALAAHFHGLKPLIIEKNSYFGGTTALSGGVIWMPNNPVMKREGIPDSEADGRRYLQETVGSGSSQARQDAFLNFGVQMIDFLEAHTAVELQRMPHYPDYYPELPGGHAEGRCVEAALFDGKKLGAFLEQLNPAIWKLADQFRVTGNEYHHIAMMRTNKAGKKKLRKVLSRLIGDKLKGRKSLAMGRSLMAMLGYSVQQAGIPLWLNTPLRELILDNGRVVGVKVEKEGEMVAFEATKGVVMATGGFAHNEEMRKQYHPQPSTSAWSLSNKSNTGDGIQIAQGVGAKLGLMEDAWWGPVSKLPDDTPFFHVSERSQPGSLMVNKEGKRFTNESKPYSELIHLIHQKHAEGEGTIPAYFIIDHKVRKRYSFGLMRAGPTPKKFLESGSVFRADTLEELAKQVGIHPENLVATVKRYNEMAKKGKDLDFGKGDSAYDRRYGDPSVSPNPCMGPLETPPFYCMRLYPGDLGTKGGIVTDEFARVIREEGSVVEGLYATGNTSAAVMGNSYPGAGATIASAMTFGYVAALHITGEV